MNEVSKWNAKATIREKEEKNGTEKELPLFEDTINIHLTHFAYIFRRYYRYTQLNVIFDIKMP